MKRKTLLLLALTVSSLLLITGCGNNSTTLPDNSGKDSIISEEDANTKRIKALDNNIDIKNIQDSIIYGYFMPSNINYAKKTIEINVNDIELYDAVDIQEMKKGEILEINNTEIKIQKIEKKDGVININGGYGSADNGEGVTLVPGDGGTYKAQLINDYATYKNLGTFTYTISDDFVLEDYFGKEPGEDPTTVTFSELENYLKGLEDFNNTFYFTNTEIHIVNNEILSITRHWVP